MLSLLLACAPDDGASVSARAGLEADVLVPDTGSADPGESDGASDTDPVVDSGLGGAGGSGLTCGDGACEGDETCWDCASDCGACDCPLEAEVIIYAQSAWNVLGDAFVADPSPCADYYLSIPAYTSDKTNPRAGGEPEAMRARGPRFHAMAEFHWTTWTGASGSWYEKGVEFRRRMVDAGYDVDAGDTWAVNELPSTVRSDDSVREAALELFRGLYDGPSGSPKAKGAAFVVGMGQSTQNFSTYEGRVRDWLEDQPFWESANLHVAWWGQEVYTDPDHVCVSGTTTAERSAAVNAYVQHFARHAEVGPDSANTAQSYLGRAYTPMMNAVWGSDGSGYGDTTVTLDQMKHHVSTQVYAARSWANGHNHPDGRIGFAWARQTGVDEADLEELAGRLAAAIHHAYDEGGGGASYACSPSGAYTWCACSVSGAAFNDGWDTFESW